MDPNSIIELLINYSDRITDFNFNFYLLIELLEQLIIAISRVLNRFIKV